MSLWEYDSVPGDMHFDYYQVNIYFFTSLKYLHVLTAHSTEEYKGI